MHQTGSTAGLIGTVVRRWSVSLLGTGLLSLALARLFRTDQWIAVGLFHEGLLIVLSIAMIVLGVWTRNQMTPTQNTRVVLWCLLGGLGAVLVTDWIFFVQTTAGEQFGRPLSLLLNSVGFGTFGGSLFGIYSVRLRQRTNELATRTDELVEKNNRLDQFARIVSHDVRNPLAIAQGHLELAKSTGKREHFETVHEAHTRIERLAEEVLTFSRIHVSLESPAPVQLSRIIEDAWTMVPTAEARLQIETAQVIVADERGLQTLFENLFRNAVSHGGDDVTVTVGPLAEGFFVEDTGEGIPADEREQVFEAGYSLSQKGTGLGLSIVRTIADSHGWTHQIADGVEGGARFEFLRVKEYDADRVQSGVSQQSV